MAILDHRIYGHGENVIYILHGIFGMKDNWHQVANQLAATHTIVASDARNHGRSFHDFQMSYSIMADDVVGLMEHLGHSTIDLIGHSMGGKTSMKFASLYPEKLRSLAIVDIALRAYPPGHLPYFKAFEEIDFLQIQSRTEAEQALLPYAPDITVRQFLLKNLEPSPGGGYQPKFNLPAIEKFYQESIGALELPTPAFSGKTAFIHGAKSNYLQSADKPLLKEKFPAAEFHTVSNAGHWVHADNPTEFLTVLRQFLTR
jgi:esterase